MYRGFSVMTLPDSWMRHGASESVEEAARQILVNSALEKFVGPDGSIDAKTLSEDWFKIIDTDVFISHSHNDRSKALALSNHLESKFGLKCFVDSTIWKSADKLLKMVDDEYCWQKRSETYNYQLRNLSTSHVHMMLAIAIAKMIDKAEVVFFLPTPQSMSAEGTTKKGETASPWIFAEIALSDLVRKTPPKRTSNAPTLEARGGVAMDGVPVNHPVDISHLTGLTPGVLEHWERIFQQRSYEHALDALYSIVPDAPQALADDVLKGVE